ncbi:MAG: hypothetical protein JSV15_02290 [Candidatus Bathyarchaeota archaeon]|nr:MAG: hypothetical protein JSV15_02290 [Candidatus Bathyarchaeota archaeon]
MLKNSLQISMANVAMIPLLILSFLAFLIVIAILWKRGKTIEALLAWNSLLLYVIALILLLK